MEYLFFVMPLLYPKQNVCHIIYITSDHLKGFKLSILIPQREIESFHYLGHNSFTINDFWGGNWRGGGVAVGTM